MTITEAFVADDGTEFVWDGDMPVPTDPTGRRIPPPPTARSIPVFSCKPKATTPLQEARNRGEHPGGPVDLHYRGQHARSTRRQSRYGF